MSQHVLFQGDVSAEVQKQIVEFSDFHLKEVNFARTTGQQLTLKEASVFRRAEDKKLQSKLVYEITVGDGTSLSVKSGLVLTTMYRPTPPSSRSHVPTSAIPPVQTC